MKLIAFSLCVFVAGVVLGATIAFRRLPLPEPQPVQVIARPQFRLERSETELPYTVPAEHLLHFTI